MRRIVITGIGIILVLVLYALLRMVFPGMPIPAAIAGLALTVGIALLIFGRRLLS